ncbi:MAG: hypothetical protein VX986_07315 [Pseudomonadota bacterium]|nr:hypothetical protein [Pseudomonadota bacterium]
MSTSEQNLKGIKKNRRSLFELEGQVMINKARAYATRSNIEENRYLILKNYVAAFVGNRQLANQNTDDIFENRIAILENVDLDENNPAQVNFREAQINKAKVDFLDHRAKLNETVLAVNEDLLNVNEVLISVNERILEANELIKTFNSHEIDANKNLLEGDIAPEEASPESNAEVVASNAERIRELTEIALSNSDRIESIYDAVATHRQIIQENSDSILSRRDGIEENHEAIVDNKKIIAEMISPTD